MTEQLESGLPDSLSGCYYFVVCCVFTRESMRGFLCSPGKHIRETHLVQFLCIDPLDNFVFIEEESKQLHRILVEFFLLHFHPVRAASKVTIL